MDRQYPRKRDAFRADAEPLDEGIPYLQHAIVEQHGAGKSDAFPLDEALAHVWLIEPDAKQYPAGLIRQCHFDDVQFRPWSLDRDLADDAGDGHVLSDTHVAQGEDCRQVDVPERIVLHEVPDGADPETLEGL